MKRSIEMADKSKPRIAWIDTAKGLGIILVVLGHTWDIPNWLYCGIYGFHMPLFFFLSGLTFKFDRFISTWDCIKQLANKYLVPYLVLSGINLALQCVWQIYLGSFSPDVLVRYFCGILYCYANVTWMPNCSPLWFLMGIMFAKLFVFFANQISDGNKYRTTGIVIFLGGVAWLADYMDIPRLPWNVLPAMMGSVFVWAGCCICNDEQFMQNGWNKITASISLVTLLLTPWILKNCPGMNENFYDNALLFMMSGFGYSFLLIRLAVLFRKNYILTSFLGMGTMVIMGFNYFARTMAIEIYYLIPFIRNYPIGPTGCFLITMAILMIIILCYNEVNAIGKRR